MFYREVPSGSWNVYRFLWCFSSVNLGFAMIAYVHRGVKESPFPEYMTRYPLLLLGISAVVFGGLHLFTATATYVFYYLSFGIGLTMGFMVDSYWEFVTALFKRGSS